MRRSQSWKRQGKERQAVGTRNWCIGETERSPGRRTGRKGLMMKSKGGRSPSMCMTVARNPMWVLSAVEAIACIMQITTILFVEDRLH